MDNLDLNDLKIAIVSPVHIQPSEAWISSLKAITTGKSNVRVIIVDDSDGKVKLPEEWDVYGYDRQKEVLGDLYSRFEVFHKSSACRNFGHFVAWRDEFDIVIALDSDCVVPPQFIGKHVEALIKRSTGWTNPIRRTGFFSRGFPYAERDRPTILNMGLWEHELDLYGTDRIGITPPLNPAADPSEVADGFMPISGMNFACWSSAIPGFLFLPNFEYQHGEGKLFKFSRHDDIWGGYIFQKLMAIRNERIRYGDPIVYHDTVVVPEEDAAEEEAMIAFENQFYMAVDTIFQQGNMEWGMYDDMFSHFAVGAEKLWKDSEWDALVDPIKFWADLFLQA